MFALLRVLLVGFARFFNNGYGIRNEVVNSCIKKLQPIIEWTKQQRLFAFYASSILVIFEGAFDKCDCSDIKDEVQIRTSGSPIQDTQDISEHYAERESEGAASGTSAVLSSEASKYPIKDGATSNTSKTGNQGPSTKFHQTNSVEKSKGCSCKRAEVKMIDFARVFPIDKLDTNYLEGLISLMGHFEQLLQAER